MTKKSVFSFVAALTTAIFTASSALADDVSAAGFDRRCLAGVAFGGTAQAVMAGVSGAGAVGRCDSTAESLRLGMAGYTFKAERDVDAMLAKMQDLGVRHLCIKDFHLPFSATDREIREFLDKCRAHDVVPYAIGPVYMKDEAKAVESFEFARRVGVKLVVGVPYEVAPGKVDAWGANRLESRKLCEFIAGLCQKYDMRFAIHNHGPALVNLFPTAESVWKKIQDLDSRMGICLDLAHEYRSFKDPSDSILRYGARVFEVHLNNVESNDDPEKYLATTLPRGAIDIVKVCQALRRIGYCGVLAIEYAKNFDDNMSDLRESVKYFNRVKSMTDPDRVKTPLRVDLPRIGTLAPRTAAEVGDSMWTIGCECLDRDYADFEQYREFLPALGIRKIRLQAGWAKCEKEKGKYDFAWLDKIVDWAIAHGLDPMLETGYGNPLYANGGSAALMGSTFPSGEALEAWDKWVEALVNHFKDRVRDYEMWNESNNVKANTPKLIAEHNVHTAKIIKRVYPEARIAGLVLGGDWARDLELCLNEMGDDAKIFTWFMFHRYACNPESEIDVLLDRRALVKKFNPDGILRQGESGATSEMVKWFSFDGVPFTEITQAKTDLRRMLTDFACGIPTSVFTICDLHYRRNGKVSYNPKGLLRADDANRVIGVKRAYYAVQNCVSVFDAAIKPVAETRFENKDTTIFWREYEKGGVPLVAFWQYAEVVGDFRKTKEAPGFNLADGRTRYPRASDRCDTFPTVFRTKSPPMKEPVWVDLLTGRVYAIPAENVLSSESGTVYVDVPCYDSPALLTERRVLSLQ